MFPVVYFRTFPFNHILKQEDEVVPDFYKQFWIPRDKLYNLSYIRNNKKKKKNFKFQIFSYFRTLVGSRKKISVMSQNLTKLK
jgi:hypothetical protein